MIGTRKTLFVAQGQGIDDKGNSRFNKCIWRQLFVKLVKRKEDTFF